MKCTKCTMPITDFGLDRCFCKNNDQAELPAEVYSTGAKIHSAYEGLYLIGQQGPQIIYGSKFTPAMHELWVAVEKALRFQKSSEGLFEYEVIEVKPLYPPVFSRSLLEMCFDVLPPSGVS